MAQEGSTSLVIQNVGKAYVIEIVDRSLLEQRNIDKLEAELMALADKAGWPRFVVNFAGVRHISSSVIGAVLSLNQKIAAMQGELRLAGIDPRLREVFRISKLDKVLRIYDSTDKALRGFS